MFGSDFVSLLEHAASLLSDEYNIHFLPDLPENNNQQHIFSEAEVIAGYTLNQGWPKPKKLKLWQIPAAGYDEVDTGSFPTGALLCSI